jgi:hypothetical protein
VSPDVQIKRIHDPPQPGDGYRVLIDRVWPRGVSSERARLDRWERELAPGAELRKWFNHVPERLRGFVPVTGAAAKWSPQAPTRTMLIKSDISDSGSKVREPTRSAGNCCSSLPPRRLSTARLGRRVAHGCRGDLAPSVPAGGKGDRLAVV